MLAEVPAQTVALDAVIFGKAFTVTVPTAVLEQPPPAVPRGPRLERPL